jgi:predicted lipoprotein
MDKSISPAAFQLNEMFRQLKEAENCLNKLKKNDPNHQAVKHIASKLEELLSIVGREYAEEIIKK